MTAKLTKAGLDALEPEKRQQAEAVGHMVGFITSRLRDDADAQACVDMILANLSAAHDEGVRDAEDVVRTLSERFPIYALKVAADALADLRALNSGRALEDG